MAKKEYLVSQDTFYTIEIDDECPVVKGFNSKEELIRHCIAFSFREFMPVIKSGGVVLKEESYSEAVILEEQ